MDNSHTETLELVREAIGQLRRGDVVDALTTLERCAFPKWQNAEDSQIDFLMAATPGTDEPAIAGRVYGDAMRKEAVLSGAAA